MTGYGKSETTIEGKKITIEVRSVNGKQLDLSVRMPAAYRYLEYEIRARATKTLQRGKVEVFINFETTSGTSAIKLNQELFRAYQTAIFDVLGNSERDDMSKNQARSNEVEAAVVSSILRIPDVMTNDTSQLSEDEQNVFLGAVNEAFECHKQFRIQEGEVLIADLLQRVDKIQEYKEQVIPYEKARIETIKNRIREQIANIGISVDESRFEQEMIFYVEKLDITEEKVRLDNHCRYFSEVAKEEDNVGRKLGFIAQEMGREINTLGSKANDFEIQVLVIKMKDELEKIKEQVLNIL